MQSFDSEIDANTKTERTGQTVLVGRVEDVPPGRGATVDLLDGRELALYNIDGQFFAIENFCPHKGAPLADGTVCGHIVQCDWHGWQFDVRNGRCLTTTSGDVASYEVSIEDGVINIVL